MRQGSILSGAFHLGLLILIVLGLPTFRRPLPEIEPISTVEVVTMAPKATAPDLPKPPTPKPPEKVPPKPVATPPAPPPQPKAEPVPTPKPPEPVPEKKAEVPKPKKEEPKPKKEPPPKPKPDRFDSILKNLDKERPTPTKVEKPRPVQQAAMPQPVQGAASLSQQLARSELDAVRDKVRPCWNFPAGAKDADQLAVDIWVSMNPDGTVREARIVDTSRMNDPFYRAAAEAALRAALNPACQPLPLPPEKYNTWKTFVFGFDPRDL